MKKSLTFWFVLIILCLQIHAQTPGIIVRPAGTAGPAVLDPNSNGYTSISTAGFGNNDITNSEIPYKTIAPLAAEPTGDLLRGPSGKYSDIVKTFDGSGFYLYTNGTNLLCRLRIGGIVSGSKGYSILIDTDQKFGATGPYADPNFQAATNGNNGNPGFEFEIVLETNFRVAIYNVDGTSIPIFVTSYSLLTNSQISVAATNDGGNPDYFYDFYVPYTAMGLTNTTPIRVIATTVMSPGPAIGGPKSDIYGLSGTDYMTDWTSFILRQPPFTADSLRSTGTGVAATCTDAPSINGPLSSTANFVAGSWTKSPFSSVNSATITLFNGTTNIGTTTVSSGGSWSIPVTGLVDNNVITAKAQGLGESQCFASNEVIVNSCNNNTHTATPVITCSSIRGFEGTMASGATVKLFKLTTAGYSLFADDATTTYKISYPTATTWRYDDVNVQSGSACTGGASDVPAGSYAAVAQLALNCASVPVFACLNGSAAPVKPEVTSLLLDGATNITGTALANSGVHLFIDGYFVQSVTASAGGIFNFVLAKKLALNQQIEINSTITGSCASTSYLANVSCYIAAPVINTNAAKQIAVGSQIAGTSSAIAGSTVTVYNAATLVSVGSTTVQANGSWLLASPTAVTATNYLAQITAHACGNSKYSDTAFTIAGTLPARCGTITGPIADTSKNVAGTVTSAVAGTSVTLFVDGIAVGSQIIAGTAWSIPVNTTVNNTTYAGAVLTISITENNKTEVNCAASQTVNCVSPAAPVISPASTTISVGQTVTYTVSSTTTGLLYSIRDNADAANMGESKFGNGATVNIVTDTFKIAGTYTIKIKSTSFSGGNCNTSSNATVVVTGVLPISITKFNGVYNNGISKLFWQTDFEQGVLDYEVERSLNGFDFKKIGQVKSIGYSSNPQNYSFEDGDLSGNIVYYRLKIQENNGTFKYSKILIFRIDMGIIVSSISPNPFTESIKLDFEMMRTQQMQINMYDLMGRLVKTIVLKANKGSNTVFVNDLQNLSTGSYFVEMMADGKKVYRDVLLKK